MPHLKKSISFPKKTDNMYTIKVILNLFLMVLDIWDIDYSEHKIYQVFLLPFCLVFTRRKCISYDVYFIFSLGSFYALWSNVDKYRIDFCVVITSFRWYAKNCKCISCSNNNICVTIFEFIENITLTEIKIHLVAFNNRTQLKKCLTDIQIDNYLGLCLLN